MDSPAISERVYLIHALGEVAEKYGDKEGGCRPARTDAVRILKTRKNDFPSRSHASKDYVRAQFACRLVQYRKHCFQHLCFADQRLLKSNIHSGDDRSVLDSHRCGQREQTDFQRLVYDRVSLPVYGFEDFHELVVLGSGRFRVSDSIRVL